MTITKEDLLAYIDKCEKEILEIDPPAPYSLTPSLTTINNRINALSDSIKKARAILRDMETGQIKPANTLEAYFRRMNEKGIIDHAIRATVWNGKVTFYIHPAMVGGDTVDFEVKGNELNTKLYMETN